MRRLKNLFWILVMLLSLFAVLSGLMDPSSFLMVGSLLGVCISGSPFFAFSYIVSM